MAKDPVCGREIDEGQQQSEVRKTAAGTPEVDPEFGTRRFHEGKWYMFCSLDCRSKFMAMPNRYVEA